MPRSEIFLAAGMPRSASTWLYNAVRLLLCSREQIAPHFSGGWISDIGKIPRKPFMLLKLHDYFPPLVQQAVGIFYSYRDIRDVLVSLERKFAQAPTLEGAEQLLFADQRWRLKADFVLRYEDFLAGEAASLAALADVVQRILTAHLKQAVLLGEAELASVLAQLQSLAYDAPGPRNQIYHLENLYHQGHRLDGRAGIWREALEPELVAAIADKYGDWFVQHGYEV